MEFGKAALLVGGVLVVGVVGAVALGMPAQMESSVPVGTFVIQMPTDLLTFEGENPLVVAPEILLAPEASLTSDPDGAFIAPQFVEPNREAYMQLPAIDERGEEEVQVSTVSQTTSQTVTQSQSHAFGACGGK